MAELAGMVNKYICSRGHIAVTILYCDGVTPFTMECREPGCGCTSYSQMYRVPQRDLGTGPFACRPSWEWRLPNEHEMRKYKKGLRKAILAHLAHGGLMCFPVSEETLVKFGFKAAAVNPDALLGVMELGRMVREDEAKKAAAEIKPDPEVMANAGFSSSSK